MPSRIERILQSIKTNAGKDIYDKICQTCGKADVKAIISELEKACGAAGVAKVLQPCGRQCISDNMIKRARVLHAKSKNLEDFLRLLNEKRIGGGKLHIKDGKIIGIYEKCYCGIAKATKGLSSLFCSCSVGWYERLFSSAFEKPVNVKMLRTILDGADKCEFEISY